jgi:hypothetical protein
VLGEFVKIWRNVGEHAASLSLLVPRLLRRHNKTCEGFPSMMFSNYRYSNEQP